MKKLVSLLVFGAVFVFFVPAVFAQSETKALSLSDAIYADLATRHNLDNVSLYYSDGDTGNDVRLNEGRHWIPASTVKMFVAMYAYKLIDDGKLKPFDTVTIEPKNSVPTELVTDELPTLIEGSSVSLARLIRQMITQSDNTAFNVLLDVVGRDGVTSYIQSLGLAHSRVGSKLNLDTSQEQYEFDVPGYGINSTTAQDYAKAFDLIKNQNIPGAKELYAILQDQKINNMIPLYLPKEVVCAHKTGDLDPLYHDGGICQDQKQAYILTIFTNAGDPNLLAHLSKLAYTKDYKLVGEALAKKPLGEELPEDHPLDPLALEVPSERVLGTSTADDYPTPLITAADLGVTSNDLSLVISDKDLPRVLIPADSRWHVVIDSLQVFQKVFSFGQKARRNVDLSASKLRLAEVKDLLKRGKTTEAHVLLQKVQPLLSAAAKDSSVALDSGGQNAIAQISETRFSILAEELKQAKGDARIALIKDIAGQAKATVKNIQPNIPDAINASNPTQKPLIGEVIKTSPTAVTVKTAGGQQVTVPVGDSSVLVKDKKGSSGAVPSLSTLALGTTVALIGSTTNNTFAPTLVLANIPKELAAPVPVTVAKVDAKHNTMVIVENGVYTQVNINKNTTIKGTGTSIPLKEIKSGDVVVVHGELLTPVPTKNLMTPTAGSSPKPTVIPLPTKPANITGSPAVTSKAPINTPTVVVSTPASTTVPATSVPKTTSVPQYPIEQTKPKTVQQPQIIQSTSIKLIEKKEDAAKSNNQAPKTPAKPASHPESNNKPPQTAPPAVLPTKEKKK